MSRLAQQVGRQMRKPQDRFNVRHWIVAVLPIVLVVMVVLIYGATLGYGYFSEDFDFAYNIAHYPWNNLWRLFVPPPQPDAAAAFYRPLGFLFWRIGGALGGFSPVPQHFINISLHALNGVLCYHLLRRVRKVQPSVAFLAAALFVLFPTHTEAVTWSAGRFDLLATLCGLLTLICAVGMSRRWLAGLVGAGCFLLALTAKESALAVPLLAVLLIVVRWWEAPESRRWRTLIIDLIWRALPLFVLVGLYLLWRVYLFGGLGGYRVGNTTQQLTLSFTDYARSFGGLLYFLVLPLNWSALLHHSADIGIAGWLLAWCMALLVVGFGLSARAHAHAALGWHECLVGILWALLAILPAVGLPNDTIWLQSSRFVYLASIGVSLALAVALGHLATILRRGWLLSGFLTIVMIVLCSSTVQGVNQRWRAASAQVQSILRDLETSLPDPPFHATLLLPSLPDSDHGAYIFRNGIASAVHMTYNASIQTLPLKGALPDALPRPDRVYAFVFEHGQLSPHPEQAQIARAYASLFYTPGLPSVRWTGDLYGEEHSLEHTWRWLRREGCIQLTAAQPQSVDLRLRLWSAGPQRSVQLDLADRPLGRFVVTSAIQEVLFTSVALPAGDACLHVRADDAQSIDASLHNGDKRTVSVAVGDLEVSLSPQLSVPPAPQHVLQTHFGDVLTLVGYDLSRVPGVFYPDQQAILTLYWRCDETLPTDLQVFAHLIDSNGQIVAQADGPPADASTPTSSWRPDQFFRHTFVLSAPLQMPPGPYRLLVGLYETQTLQRVPLDGGADALLLETW